MRIRFDVGDKVWYVARYGTIVNVIIDLVTIDTENEKVYCTIICPTFEPNATPKPKVISQYELFKTYQLALRGMKGDKTQ